MASPTTSGAICHVPRPTAGILAPVLRTKDPAIFALWGKIDERETVKEDGYGGLGVAAGVIYSLCNKLDISM